MTMPRTKTVLPDSIGYYHCVSRCVRRAFLCGEDSFTGRSFEHRRGWVEARLLDLSEVFAVGLYAYAVISDHVHVVVQVDPATPPGWSDEEVARRWCSQSRDLHVPSSADALEARSRREAALLLDCERLAELRERLGSLSWFMRVLNESIARAANREDDCTGRFWEGRFYCQYLADEHAVLGCMAYVDLNPIRAGVANQLETSRFTSIRRRITAIGREPETLDASLSPLNGVQLDGAPSLSVREYIDLVEWTRRDQRRDRVRQIDAEFLSAPVHLSCGEEVWRRLTSSLEQGFGVTVGDKRSLANFAAATGRHRVHGMSLAW